jgi:hypothetical protein
MRPPTSVGPGLVPQSRRVSDIAGAACAYTTDAEEAAAAALNDNIVNVRFIDREGLSLDLRAERMTNMLDAVPDRKPPV